MPERRYVSRYFFGECEGARGLVELFKNTEDGPWMLFFRWGVRGGEPTRFEVTMQGYFSEVRATYKARQVVRDSFAELGIEDIEDVKVGTWDHLDALEKLIAQGWTGIAAKGVIAGSFDV